MYSSAYEKKCAPRPNHVPLGLVSTNTLNLALFIPLRRDSVKSPSPISYIHVQGRIAERGLAAEGGDELARMLLRLRLWVVYYLCELAGSARQAIAVGEPLAVDSEPVLSPDYPGTLTSRNNLASARRAVSGPD